MITHEILSSPFGFYIEWYDDEEEKVCQWGGTRDDCIERAKSPPPNYEGAWFIPNDNGLPPYDAATATGMYDRD